MRGLTLSPILRSAVSRRAAMVAQPMRHLLNAAFAAGVLAFGSVSGAHAQALYGITDGGSLYEINPISKYTSLVFTQPLGMTGANGLAWDETGQHMFYRGTVGGTLNLYVWDRVSGKQYQITTGTAAVPTGPTACGTFYNGAYMYVRNQTDTLVSVRFDFSSPTAPKVSNVTELANFDGTATSSFSFGDISVRPSDGTLFGSSDEGFFSANLTTGTQTSYHLISAGGTKYQIGFGEDGTLYGENASTGAWYQMNTTTGAATSLSYASKDGSGNVIAFNDISEAALKGIAPQANAPEPVSVAFLLPAALTLPVANRLLRKRSPKTLS